MKATPLNLIKFSGLLIGLTTLIPLATGCGGPDSSLGQVSGIITLDGQPLADATVIFVHGQGRPAVGLTDAEGRYQASVTRGVPGVPPGTSKVQIITERGPSETAQGDPVPPVPERLPAKYNTQTQLQVEVQAGEAIVANFDLTSETRAAGRARGRVR